MFKRIDITLPEANTIAVALRKLAPLIYSPVPPILHGDSRETTMKWIELQASRFEEIVSCLAAYRDKDGQPGTFDPKQAAIRNGTFGT